MKFIILWYLSHMLSLSRILNAHTQPCSGTTVLNSQRLKEYFSCADPEGVWGEGVRTP